MKFDPSKKADHANNVIEDMISLNSREHGTNPSTKLVFEVIVAAIGSKTFKVPNPVFNVPIPSVTDPDTLKMLQTASNKTTMVKHTEDVNALPAATTSAFYWIIDKFVVRGSPMYNRLIAHADFKGMIDSKVTDPNRLMKAIIHILITNPGNEKNTFLNASVRKEKGKEALSHLTIAEYRADFNNFVNRFNEAVSYIDSMEDNKSAMTSTAKLATLMLKLEKDPVFRPMYYDIKAVRVPEPETIEELFGMMRMQIEQGGTPSSDKATGNFVLVAAAAEHDHTQRRASSTKARDMKPGPQKNGSIWVDPLVWAGMSADDRKKHGDKNAVLRDKAKAKSKVQEQKKAALLATKKPDGEYSSEEDEDNPYGTVLHVQGSTKKEQRNLANFDRYMRNFDNSSKQKLSPSTESSDSDSSEYSVQSAASDKHEQFSRLREAAAAAKPPQQQLMTAEEAENLANRVAEAAVKFYIASQTHPASLVTNSQNLDPDTASGANGVESQIPGGNTVQFPSEYRRVTQNIDTDQRISSAGVTDVQIAVVAQVVFTNEFLEVPKFPNLRDFLPDEEELLKTPYGQKAAGGGTVMLSRLSWLFMVIMVIAAYLLGAVRNGGGAAAAISSFPALPSAAGVRNHPPPGGVGDSGSDRTVDTTLHRVLMARKQSGGFDQFDEHNLIWDPGSMGIHLLNKPTYLCNIVDCEPGSLGGINDDSNSLDYSQCGTIIGTNISNVVLCPGAVANILCPQTALKQGYEQTYVSDGDFYTLTHTSSGKRLKFGRVDLRNGSRTTLYIMDLRTLQPPFHRHMTVAVATTVSHNKSRYTKGEVMRADKARRYLAVMGNPSSRAAIEQLRSTRNAPVSEADIRRCIDIYGPSVASIKAHTTKKTAPAARNDTLAPDEVPTHVYMEVDIMWVKGLPFLIGVVLPLDYAMCLPLTKGRGATHLEKGLKAMASKINSRNFVCDSIRSDNEGGIAKQSTTEEIQRLGIELPLTGAGQHCGHIERRIRFVKEKYRGLEHGLDFAMNKILVTWAVLGSTRMTNMQRTASSTSLLSPREKFMGRPFDFDLDGRVAFGTYIQLTVRDTDNTSSARTEGCIALFSRDNLTGSIYAFHIATQAIVVRDHFVELPISDALISYINNLAAKDGMSRGSEPFAESEYGAPTDEEYQNNDATTVNKARAFKPFNESSAGVQLEHQQRAPGTVTFSAADGESSAPLPEVPNSRGAAKATTSRVTVEDVEDEDVDREFNNISLPTAQQQQVRVGGAMQGATQVTIGDGRRGAQVFRGRGAAQNNSLAGMGGSTALLVGTDFNDPAFERKFKAQLHHTRDFHDRDFAFVISWKRAIKTYGEPARASIEKELQQFIDKGVWHPVSFEGLSKQQRKVIIRAKMFVTEKFFPNGGFDKIKSRLVARGDMQDRSLYGDDDTSAPTAELSSVFSVAAIAACESRYVATCDIGGAFLNADMFKGSGRTVIVKLDPHITKMLTKLKPDYESFVGDDGHLFVELDKAMYGCIESAKLWYEHLRGVLVNEMGFTQNECDQCAFNKTDSTGIQVTVILHVDDMMVTCANKITLDAVLLSLCQRFKETKCHYGPCVPFLGMDFDYAIPGEVRITMLGMEADILSTSGVTGVAKTPATEALFDVDIDKQPVEEQEQQDWFRSNVAKLLYLGKRARPEILTATTFLATRAAKADIDDMGKLRRVIRYLRGSAGRGIRLCPGALGVSVRAYVDAAYGVHMDGKSHTGVSIVIGEAGPIFVRSTKQPIVAKSSTEAELIATSDSANQVFHVRNFIIEQGYGDKPATIFQDNLSCMALMAKGKSTSLRTRHIQIRYFWVKERVDNGEAVIMHMRSEAMGPANALTKPLVGAQFLEERRQLTNWD